MKKLTLSVLTCLLSLLSFAQVSFKAGPESGFGISYMKNTGPGRSSEGVGLYAQAGLAGYLQIGNSFAVRPSLIYQTKRFYLDGDSVYILTNRNLMLPIDVLFSHKTRHKHCFYIGAGPYLATTLSGKAYRYRSNGYDEVVLGNHYPAYQQAFDFGLNFKVGFLARGGFFLNFNGNASLINRSPDSRNGRFGTYDVFGFSVGYLLGKVEKIERRKSRKPRRNKF